MPYFEIPVDPTDRSFSQETALDGTTYRMEFRWNSRESEWYLTIRDLDNNVLYGSIKMTSGAPLLRMIRDFDSRPLGSMYLTDLTGDTSTPGRLELGNQALLSYADEEEVDG